MFAIATTTAQGWRPGIGDPTFMGWFTILAHFAAATIVSLFWNMRREFKSIGLALVGAVFIIAFIVIRAASFHHVDEWLGWTFLGLEMNWVLELGGIACVATCAAQRALGRENAGVAPRLARRRPGQAWPDDFDPGAIHEDVVMDRRESFRWVVHRFRWRRR
jgi:hypothetical protein